MPVSYRIEGSVLVIRPMGAHSTAELRAAWLEAERDPAFPVPPRSPRVCVDVRESRSLEDRSIAEMRATTAWFIERAKRADRVCALVARPGLQYGLVRMISIWLELNGFRVCVTTDLEEAVSWLLTEPPRAASNF